MSEVSTSDPSSEDWAFLRILKELLKAGILVASCTGVGTFTVGPAGGFLGAAIGAVLTWVNASSASLALSDLMKNPLVIIVMTFLDKQLMSIGAPKLLALVVKLAKFIRESIGKMQLGAITHSTV